MFGWCTELLGLSAMTLDSFGSRPLTVDALTVDALTEEALTEEALGINLCL